MKSLKPSHRERKRYLLLEGEDANMKKIEEAILNYIGTLGFAKVSPKVVTKIKNRLILSINREKIDEVRAGFLVSGKQIRIIKVSGSLNKLKHVK